MAGLRRPVCSRATCEHKEPGRSLRAAGLELLTVNRMLGSSALMLGTIQVRQVRGPLGG